MDKKNILVLSIFTFITALGWIVFDIYHAATVSTITKNVEEQLVPITPAFETSVIDKLNNRVHVDVLGNNSVPVGTESASKIASSSSGPATKSGTR
jgi:hypothetical protein